MTYDQKITVLKEMRDSTMKRKFATVDSREFKRLENLQLFYSSLIIDMQELQSIQRRSLEQKTDAQKLEASQNNHRQL